MSSDAGVIAVEGTNTWWESINGVIHGQKCGNNKSFFVFRTSFTGASTTDSSGSNEARSHKQEEDAPTPLPNSIVFVFRVNRMGDNKNSTRTLVPLPQKRFLNYDTSAALSQTHKCFTLCRLRNIPLFLSIQIVSIAISHLVKNHGGCAMVAPNSGDARRTTTMTSKQREPARRRSNTLVAWKWSCYDESDHDNKRDPSSSGRLVNWSKQSNSNFSSWYKRPISDGRDEMLWLIWIESDFVVSATRGSAILIRTMKLHSTEIDKSFKDLNSPISTGIMFENTRILANAPSSLRWASLFPSSSTGSSTVLRGNE